MLLLCQIQQLNFLEYTATYSFQSTRNSQPATPQPSSGATNNLKSRGKVNVYNTLLPH
jgi:hypothetical protein